MEAKTDWLRGNPLRWFDRRPSRDPVPTVADWLGADTR